MLQYPTEQNARCIVLCVSVNFDLVYFFLLLSIFHSAIFFSFPSTLVLILYRWLCEKRKRINLRFGFMRALHSYVVSGDPLARASFCHVHDDRKQLILLLLYAPQCLFSLFFLRSVVCYFDRYAKYSDSLTFFCWFWFVSSTRSEYRIVI